MKLVSLICFMLLFTAYLNAQEEQVKEIRKLYNEFNDFVSKVSEEGMNHLPPKFTITVNQMMRAIGPVSTTSTIYYDENEETGETEESPDFIYTRVIRKVVSTDQLAGKIYKEYFFDTKGNLIFFYLKEEQWEFFEERYYFWNNKLIKVIRAGLPESEKGTSSDFTHTASNFSKEDKSNGTSIINSANAYKSIFSSLKATHDKSVDYY